MVVDVNDKEKVKQDNTPNKADYSEADFNKDILDQARHDDEPPIDHLADNTVLEAIEEFQASARILHKAQEQLNNLGSSASESRLRIPKMKISLALKDDFGHKLDDLLNEIDSRNEYEFYDLEKSEYPQKKWVETVAEGNLKNLTPIKMIEQIQESLSKAGVSERLFNQEKPLNDKANLQAHGDSVSGNLAQASKMLEMLKSHHAKQDVDNQKSDWQSRTEKSDNGFTRE